MPKGLLAELVFGGGSRRSWDVRGSRVAWQETPHVISLSRHLSEQRTTSSKENDSTKIESPSSYKPGSNYCLYTRCRSSRCTLSEHL